MQPSRCIGARGACALLPAALLLPRAAADMCSVVKTPNRGIQEAAQMTLTGASLQKCQQMCCDSRLRPTNMLCNSFDFFHTGDARTDGCILRSVDYATVNMGSSLAINGFPSDNYRLERSGPKYTFVTDKLCGDTTNAVAIDVNPCLTMPQGPNCRITADSCKEECTNNPQCKIVYWWTWKAGMGPAVGMGRCRLFSDASTCSDASVGPWMANGGGAISWDKATYVREDQAQVAGDPFTSFGGKNMQFYLPNAQPHLLLSCGALELSGRANSGAARGGDQQWLTAVHASFGGKEVVVVRSRDAPVRPSDENSVSVEVQTTEAKTLTTLLVDVEGGAMATTGARSLAGGAINVTVAQDPDVSIGSGLMELVRITHNNLTTVVKTSLAGKYTSAEEKLRSMHVDMQFEKMNLPCLSGPLPEIWGLQKMSPGTAKMLVPP